VIRKLGSDPDQEGLVRRCRFVAVWEDAAQRVVNADLAPRTRDVGGVLERFSDRSAALAARVIEVPKHLVRSTHFLLWMWSLHGGDLGVLPRANPR
jgi:hypothetical protein